MLDFSLPFLRWTMACAAALTLVAGGHQVLAQGAPPQFTPAPTPPPPAGGQPQAAASPVCQRLVGQLAAIDGAGGDGRAEQIRRYEEAANRQQAELERLQGQAKRQGCDSSGFFSLFSGQGAQCGPVNNQIQQMRANLDQMTSSLERLRTTGNSERDNQRRSVMLALAQNNCGPQYANAVQQSTGGFFGNLFGGGNQESAPIDNGAAAGTYRTVCARTCDGFYFPISFATVPSRFADDEKTCKSLCPASEATLFTYRNPGEDMNNAVSLTGQPYSSSPNAFRYRQAFDKACSCKGAGQTWSDALKDVDDKTALQQQGDIVVTDETAKKMAQPPSQKSSKAPAAAQKKGAPATAQTTPPAATAPAPSTATPANAAPADGDKPIRSVGPTFIPGR